MPTDVHGLMGSDGKPITDNPSPPVSDDASERPPVDDTPSDIEELRTWFLSVLERLSMAWDERTAKQDQLLDQMEQQNALLSIGFAEMAAMVESLISMQINKNPEDREEWQTTLAEARKNMLETFKHATHTAEQSADRFVAHDTDPSGPREDSAGAEPD